MLTRTSHKIFVDSKPIVGQKKVFDLSKLKDVHRDLTGYLKMSIEEISKNYWNQRESTDKEQQKLVEAASTEKEIIEYYRTTPQYLYELTSWEAQKDKQREFKKLHLFFRKFNIKKILDFGGGTGGLCIFLNNCGLRCDYLDIPGATYNFARWRFDKYKIRPKVISAVENFLSFGYDAVIAYDVFEHIFDLDSTVRKINSCLINNGYLLSKSTFSGNGVHLFKNQNYQNLKNFNQLLFKNGFEFIGQLKGDRFSRLLNKIGFRYLLFSTRLSRRLKHGGNFIIHKKTAD